MDTGRLIIDSPAEGAWNMAVDEALLDSCSRTGMPTLRFYQWSKATLSLGYFQRHRDREQHVASRDCPLVRRSTGGRAIIHDQELAIRAGKQCDPNFGTAVELHKFIDNIRESTEQGRRVAVRAN